MTPLLRWFRFNLVGALGMGVQLASLAVFNRVMPRHYLLATAAAIELTLLHNFWWHLRFTWPASRDRASRLRALMRFQLTSGLISLTGNLVLMRLFVGLLHFPVLAANLLAILCCSLANFALSDGWSFAGPPAPSLEAPALPMRELAILLLLSFPATPGHAQSLPNAPAPAIPANASYVTNAGIFCGGGASTSPVATKPAVGCGAGLKILPGILFAELH